VASDRRDRMGTSRHLVAMQATSTIPIIFKRSDNPLERRLVPAFRRSGGKRPG